MDGAEINGRKIRYYPWRHSPSLDNNPCGIAAIIIGDDYQLGFFQSFIGW